MVRACSRTFDKCESSNVIVNATMPVAQMTDTSVSPLDFS